MSDLNKQQKLLMDKAIELVQENKRLAAELQKVKEQRDATQATMDAVIAAFLRTGAPAPNVDAECWGVKAYKIVQNDGFFTIGRTDEEIEKEGGSKWGKEDGLPGKERRSLTYSQRAKLRSRSRRITALLVIL